MTRYFVSYARKDDEPFARWLRTELSARGFEIWWDREAMSSRGLSFLHEIFDAIRSADRLLLVVGPAALRSDYVTAEWRHALEVCTVVTPILRLGSEVPEPLRHLHRIDFRQPRPPEEALEELVRILAEPVPLLGLTFGVDKLPAHYRERPAALDALKRSLLGDTRRPTAIVSAATTTSLHGLGGLGKSVLAAAAARDCEVRRTFGDGVHWLRLGPRSDLDGALRSLLKNLGVGSRAAIGQPEEVLAAIEGRLAGRACLIVLDDVWDPHDVEGLQNALGGRCRLLLTTRDAGIGHRIGAEQLPLGTLSEREALDLLADWAGLEVDALPREAAEIARECECLPLALAMIGARVGRRSGRWADMLDRLRAADLERIRGDFPNYPYPSVLRAIEVSVDALDPVERELYLSLAAFPEAGVPESVLALTWSELGLDEPDIQDAVDALADASLLRADEAGGLRLHPLQHDFVRRRTGDLARIHRALLAGYSERYPGGWAAAEDDGYLFDHLARHLVAAGRAEELSGLLASRAWLERRIEVSGAGALIEDFSHRPDDPAAVRVREALQLSMSAIAREPAQVWGQLKARLRPPFPPAVEALLADPPPPPRLEPIVSPVVSPGGSLLQAIDVGEASVRAFASTPDRLVAVLGTTAGARVLDLESGRTVAVVRPGEEIRAVAVSSDGFRVAMLVEDGGIEVCEARSGEPVVLLPGHPPEDLPWESLPTGVLSGMVFDQDGFRLVSAATDGLVAWDVSRGEVVWRRRDLVVSALGSLGDHHLAVAGFSTARLDELAEATRRAADRRGSDVRANPGGWLSVLDARTGATLETIPVDHAEYLVRAGLRVAHSLASTPDGSLLATSVNLVGVRRHPRRLRSKVRVWDRKTGAVRFRVYTKSSPSLVALSPDGRCIAIATSPAGDEGGHTAGERGKIEVRELETGRIRTTVRGLPGEFCALDWLAPGRLVAAVADGVTVWDPDVGGTSTPERGENLSAVEQLQALGSAEIRSRARDGSELCWDPSSGERLHDREEAEPTVVLSWALLEGTRFQSESRIDIPYSGGVRRWLIRREGLTERVDARATADTSETLGPPWSLELGDGRRAVCSESEWCVVETEIHGAIGGMAGRGEEAGMPCPGLRALAATADRRLLLTGLEHGEVWVWDLETRQVAAVLAGPAGAITDLEVSDDDRFVVAASRDRSVTVWSLASGHRLARYFGDVEMVACSTHGSGESIVAVDREGVLHFLHLVVGQLDPSETRPSPPVAVVERVRDERRKQREVLDAAQEVDRLYERLQREEEGRRYLRWLNHPRVDLRMWTKPDVDRDLGGGDMKAVSYVVVRLQEHDRPQQVDETGRTIVEGDPVPQAYLVGEPGTMLLEEDLVDDTFAHWVVAQTIHRFPEELTKEDLDYVRVYYEVVDRKPLPPKTAFDEAQLETLLAIERALKGPPDGD